MNYIIGGILIAFIYLFSREILSLFLTNTNTVEIAHSLVMITLWSYLIFGHAQIIGATMRASGTVLWPTIIGVVSIWLVEVPVAYYLSYHTNLGIKGIWIGYPADLLQVYFCNMDIINFHGRRNEFQDLLVRIEGEK